MTKECVICLISDCHPQLRTLSPCCDCQANVCEKMLEKWINNHHRCMICHKAIDLEKTAVKCTVWNCLYKVFCIN